MVNRSNIHQHLQSFGLTPAEATIYLALLKQEQNHLQLSRTTNLNRTSVYRFVDSLIERGIVQVVSSHRGKVLRADPPQELERLVHETELKVEEQRLALSSLKDIVNQNAIELGFSITTYNGKDGLKQLLWRELSTQGEILIFSNTESLNIPFGRRFAEKFRLEIIKRKIKQRALHNSDEASSKSFSNLPYDTYYTPRYIPSKILQISQEVSILIDRVNIYSWNNGEYVGTEIRNAAYAQFMKGIFEALWVQAGDQTTTKESKSRKRRNI